MKHFLLVALLGLLSYGANAHRTGHGRSHHHGSRYYTPYNGRQVQVYIGGGQGWNRHYRGNGHRSRFGGRGYGHRQYGNGGNRGYSYNQNGYGYGGRRGGRGYSQNNGGGGQYNNNGQGGQQYEGRGRR